MAASCIRGSHPQGFKRRTPETPHERGESTAWVRGATTIATCATPTAPAGSTGGRR
jgi:hypothetical protein